MFLIFGRREKGVVEGVRALNLYSSCFFSLIRVKLYFHMMGWINVNIFVLFLRRAVEGMCYKSSDPFLFIYLPFSGKIIAVSF